MPANNRKNLKKSVKRLNPMQRNEGRILHMRAPPKPVPPPLQPVPMQADSEYHTELMSFLAMRNKSNNNNNNNSSASELTLVPSQELIWTRDDSSVRPSNEFPGLHSPIRPPSATVVQIDDEIEEGEIVETEVTGIVNLLAESFAAVTKSRQLVDLTSPNKPDFFYEDRSQNKFGAFPKYKAFGENSNDQSNDVICLDSTQEEVDDSVIFVSEEKQMPVAKKNLRGKAPGRLVTPDCLKTPALNKIFGIQAPKVTKTKSPKKKLRLALWKEKKAQQFKAAEQKLLEAGGTPVASGATPPVASTSSAASTSQQPVEKVVDVTPKGPEKRIILIDGSNMAMGYTDNYGPKKTDKDFSAEGLKVGIEHFEQLGFQVKAIVPEFRLRREKSSNQAIMRQLYETGKLVPTPSKSYDDRVILESAVRLDAAVVSNDHYRDLLNEKPEYKEVVSRLIRFNWLFQKLIITEDPHGKFGPKLNDILYKKVNATTAT